MKLLGVFSFLFASLLVFGEIDVQDPVRWNAELQQSLAETGISVSVKRFHYSENKQLGFTLLIDAPSKGVPAVTVRFQLDLKKGWGSKKVTNLQLSSDNLIMAANTQALPKLLSVLQEVGLKLYEQRIVLPNVLFDEGSRESSHVSFDNGKYNIASSSRIHNKDIVLGSAFLTTLAANFPAYNFNYLTAVLAEIAVFNIDRKTPVPVSIPIGGRRTCIYEVMASYR